MIPLPCRKGIRGGLETTRDIPEPAQNLSTDSIPLVSLNSCKFEFTVNKQAVKEGGFKYGHLFFTHTVALS